MDRVEVSAYRFGRSSISGADLIGNGHAPARAMNKPSTKPYDIHQRVFIFACETIAAFPKERLDTPSLKVWSQLIASATSSGAHLEEAAAGGTRAHFLALV